MGHLPRLLKEVEFICIQLVRFLFFLRKWVILTIKSRNLIEPIVLV